MDDWHYQPARDHGLSERERWKSVHRESGLISTGLHVSWWGLVRCYMSLWHRLQVEGKANLPSAPPYVLVANHTSHLDAMVLGSALPWQLRHRTLPLAAGDVFFYRPTIAAFAANVLNALPMWRKSCGRHALAQLRQRLIEEPCGYILFPEGTRSRDKKMQPFKVGMGMLVAETQAMVIPCHLEGCQEAMNASARFPKPKRIRLRIGPALSFATIQNNREGWEQIVTEVENAVRNLAEK
jgi:1-acyl-sn-glycerol-3-phosphate acyltransferase